MLINYSKTVSYSAINYVDSIGYFVCGVWNAIWTGYL